MSKNKKQQQKQQKVCPFIYEENYVIPKDINTSHNITQFIEQPVLDKYICKNVNENGIIYDWLNHWFTSFKTANKKSKRKANSKKPINTYSTTEEISKQETKTGPFKKIKNFIEKFSGNNGKQLIPCPISDETHFLLPKNLIKDPIDIIGSNTLTKTICDYKKRPITGDLISFCAILFIGSVYLIKRFTNKANIARNRNNQPLNSDTLLNSMQVEISFQDGNGGTISPIPSSPIPSFDEGDENNLDNQSFNHHEDSLQQYATNQDQSSDSEESNGSESSVQSFITENSEVERYNLNGGF